jgi:antibiotic biosynthesis monooxygenase (ABM) superfamily enzyme
MTDVPMRAPAPPPRYKLALLTWIGVYPLITLSSSRSWARRPRPGRSR